MDFLQYISTPALTLESNPLVTKLRLTHGRLIGGYLHFPYGPAATLHFLARIGNHQILPFNTGQNYRLDDAVMPFTLGIDLTEPPYIIDLITWNDSTSYAHALTMAFSIG